LSSLFLIFVDLLYKKVYTINQKGGRPLNERIKKLRKALNLTLEVFGNKIGISKSAASKIEKGKSGVTERTIKLICQEFGVDEDWLRTGKGGDSAMFREENRHIVERLSEEYKLTDLEKAIVTSFLELNQEARNAIIEYVEKLIEKLSTPEQEIKKEISVETDSFAKTSDNDVQIDSAGLAASQNPVPSMSYDDIVRQMEELQRDNKELRKKVEILEQEDALNKEKELKSTLSMIYGQ